MVITTSQCVELLAGGFLIDNDGFENIIEVNEFSLLFLIFYESFWVVLTLWQVQ